MSALESLFNKKILIVDDTASMRMLVRAVLWDAGFHDIYQAKNGEDALSQLEKQTIDLIICDWNMPVMSGLELFKQVNADSELKDTGFILLTSSSEGEKVKEAISSGISSYLLKPFKPEALLQHITKFLSEK